MTISVKDATGSTQTVKTIDDLAADGGDATKGAKADAAYAGSGAASIVSILKGLYNAMIAATPAGSNLIGSVSVAPSTTDVVVTPTVTASAYTAGNVLGGIMTFANILAPSSFNGILHSITAKFKGAAVTGNLQVAIFKASPSNGTYTDKTAPTWNAADMANLLGIYTLPVPNSKLGTMTVYNLDGIGKAIVGASQSLFAVVIVDGTPTPASTSDFSLEFAVLPG